MGAATTEHLSNHSSSFRLPRPQYACMKQQSHSQWREDIRLVSLLMCAVGIGQHGRLGHHKARVGAFVELGANNGVSHSNTFMLERCFGWSGLQIEASPTNFAQLQRSVRNVTKRHAAVCPEGKGHIRFDEDGDGELSSVASAVPAHAGWMPAVPASQHHVTASIDVPCDTLTQLLAEAKMQGADFLSLGSNFLSLVPTSKAAARWFQPPTSLYQP